jgi:hypothetical protein
MVNPRKRRASDDVQEPLPREPPLPYHLRQQLTDQIEPFPRGWTTKPVAEIKRMILDLIPRNTVRSGKPLDSNIIARYDLALYYMSRLVQSPDKSLRAAVEQLRSAFGEKGLDHLLSDEEVESTEDIFGTYQKAIDSLMETFEQKRKAMEFENTVKLKAKDSEIAKLRAEVNAAEEKAQEMETDRQDAHARQQQQESLRLLQDRLHKSERDGERHLQGTIIAETTDQLNAAFAFVQGAKDMVRETEVKMKKVQADTASLSEKQYKSFVRAVERTLGVSVRSGWGLAGRRGDHIQEALGKVAAQLKDLRAKDVDGSKHRDAIAVIITALKSGGLLTDQAALTIGIDNAEEIAKSIAANLAELERVGEEAVRKLDEANAANVRSVTLMDETLTVLQGGHISNMTPDQHQLVIAASNQVRRTANLERKIAEGEKSIQEKEQELADGQAGHSKAVNDMKEQLRQLEEAKRSAASQQESLNAKLELLRTSLKSVTDTWKTFEQISNDLTGREFDKAAWRFRQIEEEGDTFTLELKEMVSRMVEFKAVKEAHGDLSRQSTGLFNKIKELEANVDAMRGERDAARNDTETIRQQASTIQLSGEQKVLWMQGRYVEVFTGMLQELQSSKQLVDNLQAAATEVTNTVLADYRKQLDEAFKYLEGTLGDELMESARATVDVRGGVVEETKRVEYLAQAIRSLELSLQRSGREEAEKNLDRVRIQFETKQKEQEAQLLRLQYDLQDAELDRRAYEHLRVEFERTTALLDAAEADHVILYDKIDELETKLTEAHQKQGDLADKLADQLGEAHQMQEVDDAFSSRLIDTISKLSEEKGLAADHMEQTKKTIYDLRRKVLEFEDLEVKLDRANASIVDLKGQLKSEEDHHRRYIAESKRLEIKLHADVRNAEARLGAAHEDNAKFEAEVKVLKESLAAHELESDADLTAKTAEVDALKAKNDDLVKQYDEKRAQLAEAERIRLQDEVSDQGSWDALTSSVVKLTDDLKIAEDKLRLKEGCYDCAWLSLTALSTVTCNLWL